MKWERLLEFSHCTIFSLFFFLKYILLIMLLQLSYFFPPLYCLPSTVPSTTLSFPHLTSCSWVIHINSLASPFPILFWTSPCLFCTYHLCFLFSVPFPPFSPLPLHADNAPCNLYFCESAPFLVVCLVCFCFTFLSSIVDSWSLLSFFTVLSFDLLLCLRLVPLTFHIIRAWWWWTPWTSPYLGSTLSPFPF